MKISEVVKKIEEGKIKIKKVLKASNGVFLIFNNQSDAEDAYEIAKKTANTPEKVYMATNSIRFAKDDGSMKESTTRDKMRNMLRESVGDHVELEFTIMATTEPSTEYGNSNFIDLLSINSDIEVKEIELKDGKLCVDLVHYGITPSDLKNFIKIIEARYGVLLSKYEAEDLEEYETEDDDTESAQTVGYDNGYDNDYYESVNVVKIEFKKAPSEDALLVASNRSGIIFEGVEVTDNVATFKFDGPIGSDAKKLEKYLNEMFNGAKLKK